MPSQSPILAQTLPNGLTVLLREARQAPVASLWTWYRVGSRNEIPGLTSISHWVEHMQFKGTPSLAKGAIFRDISKQGGVLNAFTSQDWTTYFETLPADRLDLALQIEADRMTNSLFDPAETESERTVILSERQGAENGPTYLLYEEVIGAVFHAHAYRHAVIGHEADLRAISRDDLYRHYRRHYVPNNAVICAAGDFAAEDLYQRIEQTFGAIPAGPEPPPVRGVEPPQRGERRVTLRRPAPTSYLQMAFRTPAAPDPNTAALFVLDAVLSGGKGMGIAGGGLMGRSARLYRALVATGLARGASTSFDLYLDPYLLMLTVTALPDTEPTRIEETIDRELARLRDEVIPEPELERALKQVTAQYVYSAEGVTNQAFWLGQMEMVETYRRADSFLSELERVTPDDVQRVARTSLTPENRTVGWLHPDGAGTAGAHSGAPGLAAVTPRVWALSGGRQAPFERFRLPNGIVVLGQARPSEPAVTTQIRIEAGPAASPAAPPGLAAFTGRMLSRGTPSRDFAAFNELTDQLGATVGVEVHRHAVEVHLRCLREDLPALLALAADIIRNPVFPADEVEKVRQELMASIREQDDQTRTVADRALRQLLFPTGHPYRERISGEIESVAAISRDDLQGFHAAHYGPRVMSMAIVGGIDSVERAASQIEERFGDWHADAAPPPEPPAVEPPATARHDSRIVAGKSQSDLVVGFPTLARSHPDYYALETANLILGRLGLMGRLGASVRDQQGLAYYVFSNVEAGRASSLWTSRAGVDPTNVNQALESIVAELRRLRDEPVAPDELADAQSYLTGVLPLALETSGGVAGLLLNIEYHDLGLDYVERYPAIIRALTRDALQTAARTHLDPDRLAIGIAGPAEPAAVTMTTSGAGTTA